MAPQLPLSQYALMRASYSSSAFGRSRKIRKLPSPPLLPGMLMVHASKTLLLTTE